MDLQIVQVAAPSVPAGGATVTMFDSTKVFGAGNMNMMGGGRVSLSFPGLDVASATNGLKGYTSSDGGTTWDPFTFAVVGSSAQLPATVAICSATDYKSYDIFVANWRDVKFTYTADTSPPTVWRPVVTYRRGDVHVGY